MSVHSGGVLLFRFRDGRLQVLLVHPGGPFWTRKDVGAWSIPKGVFEEHESPLDAAKREFKEETGFEVDGDFIELGTLRQPSRKIVHVWALKRDLDEKLVVSNKFSLEWPRRSGIIREYPEIDKAAWFDIDEARRMIQKGQAGFIDRLIRAVGPMPEKGRYPDCADRIDICSGSDQPQGEGDRPGNRKASFGQRSLEGWSRGRDPAPGQYY